MNSDIQRVAAWLQPEGIHLDVPLRDSRHALEFIADAIAGRHALEPAPVFRALWRREQAGSTGLGAGFAVPHARIAGIARPLTLLLRASRPIAFEAPDHDPVWLMLAILVPDDGHADDHLLLLALVAELFSDPTFRALVDTAVDRDAVTAAFDAAVDGVFRERSGIRRPPR